MQNWWRKWYSMIIFGVIYSLLVVAILYGDIRERPDPSNLLLHVSLLTSAFCLLGLVFWFGPRWKYFRLTMWAVYIVFFGMLGIDRLSDRKILGVATCAICFLWGTSQFKKEIAKLWLSSKSQTVANQLLE